MRGKEGGEGCAPRGEGDKAGRSTEGGEGRDGDHSESGKLTVNNLLRNLGLRTGGYQVTTESGREGVRHMGIFNAE